MTKLTASVAAQNLLIDMLIDNSKLSKELSQYIK